MKTRKIVSILTLSMALSFVRVCETFSVNS